MRKTIFVVYERADTGYFSEWTAPSVEGGTPLAAFTTREKAEDWTKSVGLGDAEIDEITLDPNGDAYE